MSTINILETAKKVFQHQSKELSSILERLGESFTNSVEAILKSNGKVVIVGVGKNMPIAQKIVATLNSTGTTAQFLHAAEAIHGDLGLIDKNDIVLVLSKSGNTAEIKAILPFLKQYSSGVIAITGNLDSELAKKADFVLDTTVEKESDLNNLAPTSSTTAQLVMGDALAVALIQQRGFGSNEFAKFHPGGSLGKKLLWTVADVYNPQEHPSVHPEDSMDKVIESLSYSKNGITVLLENDKVIGVITDGDLRRMLSNYNNFSELKAKEIATLNPTTVTDTTLASTALNILNDKKIGQLVVVNEQNKYIGILDFHDLLKEGIH